MNGAVSTMSVSLSALGTARDRPAGTSPSEGIRVPLDDRLAQQIVEVLAPQRVMEEVMHDVSLLPSRQSVCCR
jgi:hypothetical protein